MLIKEYGNGQKRSGDDAGSQVHCFYDPAQKLWIELEFSSKEHTKHNIQLTGIFVTAMPMCATSFKPKKPFSNLVSEYGVGLGDKESIVIEKMGSPTRRDDVVTLESKSPYLAKDNRYASKFGGTRLVYDDNPSSLLFNFYGFESGKVTSIWIADTE